MGLTRTNVVIAGLLRGEAYLTARQTITWEFLDHAKDHDELGRMVDVTLCRSIADKFAGELLDSVAMQAKQRREPEGVVFEVQAYVMSYERMIRLLERAYAAGRLDAPRVAVPET
jgi:hypothetical protein